MALRLSIAGALLLFLLSGTVSHAQDDLFGPQGGGASRQALLIGAHAGIDQPWGDMADRFGTSYRVGGSLQYRMKGNWQFGLKGDFLFGNQLREDSLLRNLRDPSGFFLTDDGVRTGFEISERGYLVGVVAGKMFPFRKTQPDRGLLVQLGGGFFQHKINYYNQQDNVAQLRGDYRKGYDRLTNGIYLEPYVGYQHFSDNGLVNFHAGIGATLGFTAGRRDYQYDLGRPLTESRFDGLIGLRAGWYFAIYRRTNEDIFFE